MNETKISRETGHEWIELQGVWVDKNIAPLLKMLWDRGFDTQFSCQGGAQEYRGGVVRNQDAYILFTDFNDAVEFMRTTAEKIGFDDFHIHGSRYRVTLCTNGRGSVRFGPDMLAPTIKVWEEIISDSSSLH